MTQYKTCTEARTAPASCHWPGPSPQLVSPTTDQPWPASSCATRGPPLSPCTPVTWPGSTNHSSPGNRPSWSAWSCRRTAGPRRSWRGSRGGPPGCWWTGTAGTGQSALGFVTRHQWCPHWRFWCTPGRWRWAASPAWGCGSSRRPPAPAPTQTAGSAPSPRTPHSASRCPHSLAGVAANQAGKCQNSVNFYRIWETRGPNLFLLTG